MLCALCVLLFTATARAEQWVNVVYVVDGDTVEIEGDERVRLLGIDAPEDKRLRKAKDGGRRLVPAQPFFIEAKRLLRELVAKRRVKMLSGAESVDFYGRTLAYLELPDGADVQRELIRHGYAMVVAYPPNLRHLRAYSQSEAEACRARRGIWGHPHFALQNLDAIDDNADIRHGLGRIAGVVTEVKHTGKNIRITLGGLGGPGGRVTLLIYRGAWRKYWGGRDPKDWLGERLIARGRVKPAGKHKTVRIRHPFMLRKQVCAAWHGGDEE